VLLLEGGKLQSSSTNAADDKHMLPHPISTATIKNIYISNSTQ